MHYGVEDRMLANSRDEKEENVQTSTFSGFIAHAATHALSRLFLTFF